MSVLQVILIAIAAMAGVVLMFVPLIVSQNGLDAWRAIPQEIYARSAQRVWCFRPLQLWVAFGALGFTGQFFESMNWQTPLYITEAVGRLVLGTVLVWHILWAVAILRRQVELDARLIRFAKYALWGAAMALVVLLADVWVKYASL